MKESDIQSEIMCALGEHPDVANIFELDKKEAKLLIDELKEFVGA